ncbi:hypothetical protein ES703_123114 [subsurface metagenome]
MDDILIGVAEHNIGVGSTGPLHRYFRWIHFIIVPNPRVLEAHGVNISHNAVEIYPGINFTLRHVVAMYRNRRKFPACSLVVDINNQ